MRVLLVEDDEQLGSSLHRALDHAGYAVDWLKNAEEAGAAVTTESFDLIVLDWMLPGRSGVELMQILRQQGHTTPVLMLTARRDTDSKIEGLDAGADDYLTKPFDLLELLARLRALTRRREVQPVLILTADGITLDPTSCTAIVDGQSIDLSKMEGAILQALMENQGRYVSKSQLEESIYSWDNIVTENAIEAHISRLRKRLGPDCIKTLRGAGYKMG